MLKRLTAKPSMRAAIAALIVCVCLVSYISWFWTGDIEESTKISYSAGVSLSSPFSQNAPDRSGFHSVLGVPVYDTLQGTGNRLPYQASWAQSITWPLRFLTSWQLLTSIRTLFFALPTMWLAMLMLLSWVPRSSLLRLCLFGFLISAPFGLYLRQNEWSDTYVQTVGILGICFLLLHRSFFDETTRIELRLSRFAPLAAFVSLNGVLTGHPGVWPIGFYVWMFLLLCLATYPQFRKGLGEWLVTNKLVTAVAIGTSLVAIGTVVLDLWAESRGLSFGADRLTEAQGFMGTEAFRGFSMGLLPDFVERWISLAATTALAPLARFLRVITDGSGELNHLGYLSERSEFAATLVVVAFMLGYRRIADQTLRALIPRLFLAQLGAITLVVFAAVDLLPAILTPSGVWQLFPVLLVLNVTVSMILLDRITKSISGSRVLLYLNLFATAIWAAVLVLSPLSNNTIGVPERFSAWFGAAARNVDDEATTRLPENQRTIMLDDTGSGESELPRWSVFLELVSRGRPVVAPSDPKTRNSTHLSKTFAFQSSVEFWEPRRSAIGGDLAPTSEVLSERVSQKIATVTDFLQIGTILMSSSPNDADFVSEVESAGFRKVSNFIDGNMTVALRGYQFRVLRRDQFHSFLFGKGELPVDTRCAVLYENCKVLSAEKIAPRESPALSTCRGQECLWKYDAPSFRSDRVLVVPITYDESLQVAEKSGQEFFTYNVEGFLGIGSDQDVPASELTISLRPDLRIGLRVITSYLNLMAFVAVAILTVKRVLRSR